MGEVQLHSIISVDALQLVPSFHLPEVDLDSQMA
jgi:hypothetical protein